jgi:hypothetical protein
MVIAGLVPVMLLVTVSVAVNVQVPVTAMVTLKAWTPASPLVNA